MCGIVHPTSITITKEKKKHFEKYKKQTSSNNEEMDIYRIRII
jgi:hypothetical protein